MISLNKRNSSKVCALFLIALFAVACEERNEIEPAPVPPLSYTDTIHNLYKDITSDTTLKNLSTAGVDYRITNMLHVLNGATLTIEAGVNIQVVQNGGIYVGSGSALKINGTAATAVTISGQTKTKGFWNGIIFENTANPDNQLSFTTIEYAGGDVSNLNKSAAISLFNSDVNFSNCTVRNNKYFGFSFDSTSTTQMHNCTITSNDSMPVLMMHDNFGLLTPDNNYLGNKDDRILIKSTIGILSTQPQIIKKIGIPYYLVGTSYFGNAVTLEAGVKFIMAKLSSMYFNNSISGNANFTASGTSTNPIIIEGVKPDSGSWQGIVIHGGGNTSLNYCQLKYAGTAVDFGYTGHGGTLMLSGGAPGILNMTNCTIHSSFYNGVIINTPDITYNADIETSNTFTQIGDSTVLYY